MVRWLEGLVSLAAPARCAACSDALPSDADAFCAPCGVSVERCRDQTAVLEYGGPVVDAIRRFKYEAQSHLAIPLGTMLADGARVWSGQVDAVVPVPLHWRRRRARGFDQAALLAKAVARALDVPLRLRVLRRVRDTPQQATLSRAARRDNVRGAFACKPFAGRPRVLLVDDVRTTGATLAAAASTLRRAGASEVHSLVLAVRLLGQAA